MKSVDKTIRVDKRRGKVFSIRIESRNYFVGLRSKLRVFDVLVDILFLGDSPVWYLKGNTVGTFGFWNKLEEVGAFGPAESCLVHSFIDF